MNLSKLFETQKKLDERIVEEKGLEGQDLLDEKILALLTELGELSNEWRGFKFWSENQEPRTKVLHLCPHCDEGRVQDDFSPYITMRCGVCEGDYFLGKSNPMLIEYVDCLHFILSIGNELGYQNVIPNDYLHRADNTTKQFNYVFYTIMSIDERIVCNDYEDMEECYGYLLGGFEELGKQLGFTWQEIKQFYYDKNKINHERQANGY